MGEKIVEASGAGWEARLQVGKGCKSDLEADFFPGDCGKGGKEA